MANNQVKITGGSLDGSELTNAASEVTLAALLATMKTMAQQSGPKSKKAAKELDNFTESTEDASDAVDDLSSSARTLKGDLASLTSNGFRILQQGIVGFASGLDNAANNIINFGADLIQSQPEITDFTSSLANSRLNVLGLGTAVHRLTELIMGNYRSFQTLSQSGIFLGDRISSLQGDFAALGIDSNTLTSAIANNAEQFAMNGSASIAVARALDGMRSGIKDTRQELLSYGISLEEQTEIFTSMYARNTRALRLGLTTTDEINQQSATYAKSLRLISELTGVSAREMEDQQKRLDQEHAFQLKLRQLEQDGQGEVANKLRAYVAYMENSLEEGGRDIAIAQTIGTEATTDAAIGLRGLMNGVDNFSNEMFRATMDGNLTADQFREYFTERGKELGSMQVLGRDLSTAQQLINMGEGQVVGAILRFVRIFDDESDKIMSNLGNLDESGAVIGSFTDLMVAFRTGVAAVSEAFFANSTVQTGLVSFRTWLDNFTNNVEEFNLTEFLEKFNPFDETGRANITSEFGKLIGTMGDAISNFWNGPNAVGLRNTISDFFELLVEELILGISETTGGMILGDSAKEIKTERLRNATESGSLSDDDINFRDELLATEQARVDSFISYINDMARINGSIDEHLTNEFNNTLEQMREFSTEDQIARIEQDRQAALENYFGSQAESIKTQMSEIEQMISNFNSTEFTDSAGFLGFGAKTAEQQQQEALERVLQTISSTLDIINREYDVESNPLIAPLITELGDLTNTLQDQESVDNERIVAQFERLTRVIDSLSHDRVLTELGDLNNTLQDQESVDNERIVAQFERLTRVIDSLSGIGPNTPDHDRVLTEVLNKYSSLAIAYPEIHSNINDQVDTGRRIGTLQATGMRSEPKDTVAQIHAGERVLNAEETNEYNNRSNQNNQRPMLEKLDQLNSTMMTVASLLTQELSIQTRTMNRISGLGPDLMKGMP